MWILYDVFILNFELSPLKLHKLMATLYVPLDCKCWSGLILSNYSLLHPSPLSLNTPLYPQGFPALHTTTRAKGSTIINQHKGWFNQMSIEATKWSQRALKIRIRRNIKQRRSVNEFIKKQDETRIDTWSPVIWWRTSKGFFQIHLEHGHVMGWLCKRLKKGSSPRGVLVLFCKEFPHNTKLQREFCKRTGRNLLHLLTQLPSPF